MSKRTYTQDDVIALINRERAEILRLLSTSEFTSLEHMPHEADLIINNRPTEVDHVHSVR